jgi:hypothetical protein
LPRSNVAVGHQNAENKANSALCIFASFFDEDVKLKSHR